MKKQIILLIFCVTLVGSMPTQAKERTGWGWGGVPAINYNADDGFGYGVLLNLFNYSSGGYSPYYFKINPIIFATTGGKQDHTLFFDSPYMLGHGLRINARIRIQKEKFYPYYGLGNDSEYHASYVETDDDENSLDTLHGKYYYRMKTNQYKFFTNLQKAFMYGKDGKPLISGLIGLGVVSVSNEELNNDGIPTLFETDKNSSVLSSKEAKGGLNNFIKVGVIYDTRDNEPAPNSGVWTEALVEWYTKLLGSDYSFARLTLTDRRYFPITKKLVYANRVVFENIFGDAPFNMLYPYGSSWAADEGVGGYRTLRGVFKNRYIGTTKLFMNMEFRYKFYEFSLFNQDFYLAGNLFCDAGRVWYDEPVNSLKNLHIGKGAGLHIAWNENFIVYADMGHSTESGRQLYIDIGYLF